MKLLRCVPILLITTTVNALPTATTLTKLVCQKNIHSGTNVKVTSAHYYYFNNDSNQTVRFTVKSKICVPDKNIECEVKLENFDIYPGQTFNGSRDIPQTIHFTMPGTKYIYAFTEVTGAAYSRNDIGDYLNVIP